MSKPDPKRGDRSDDPTGLRDLWQDRPAGHLGRDVVRTGSSNAERDKANPNQPIETNLPRQTVSTAYSAFTQSERGLDSAERSPEGDPEARASGKSGGTRSDRSETSCGWRGVAVALHAEEGQRHE